MYFINIQQISTVDITMVYYSHLGDKTFGRQTFGRQIFSQMSIWATRNWTFGRQ